MFVTVYLLMDFLINKVSFKKSMDKMAMNEPDYGGFGFFFKLEKEF